MIRGLSGPRVSGRDVSPDPRPGTVTRIVSEVLAELGLCAACAVTVGVLMFFPAWLAGLL